MGAVNVLAPDVGMARACAALRVHRTGVHRNDTRRRHLSLLAGNAFATAGAPAGPERGRTSGAQRCAVQRTLCRLRSIHPLRHAARRKHLSGFGDHVPIVGCRWTGPQTAPSKHPSRLHQTRNAGHLAQRGLKLGNYQDQGTCQVDLLSPVRDLGYLQSLCCGLDDRALARARNCPQPPKLPVAAWINPPKKESDLSKKSTDCTLNKCIPVSQSY